MIVEIELKKSKYAKGNAIDKPAGQEFTGVGYAGKTYGGICPCDTQEEINRAIENAKEVEAREIHLNL